MKCYLCANEVEKDSKLCCSCNNERMRAALIDRISAGGFLTYNNALNFSEDKWIEHKSHA